VSDVSIVLTVLGVTIILFVWNRFPVEIVAISASLSLVATGILTTNEALAGFGDPTVVFIASLFVVSTALDQTGVTAWAGQQLLRAAGESRTKLMLATMGLAAVMTAIISVNGAVAALLPMVVVMAIRLRQPTSQMLMPLAFAAHAGSMLALTGTPVNVLAADAAEDAGVGRFGYFEFALVGIPLLIGVIGLTLLLGPRLLPHRTPKTLPPDLSAHARTLGRQYLGDGQVFRLQVSPGSAVIARSAADVAARLPSDVELIGVVVSGAESLGRPAAISVGDVVILRGDAEQIHGFVAGAGLEMLSTAGLTQPADQLLGKRYGVVELVIPPRSGLIGARVFPGMVTESGDLVVLAVQRKGEDLGSTEVEIAVGDTLLVQGAWEALDREIEIDRDVLPVDEPTAVRSQAVPLGPRSIEALIITGAMVVLLATGLVPAAIAGLLAAMAMILFGVLTVPQAYGGVSWTTVFLVGGMIPISVAMQVSGTADRIADVLVDVVGDAGPRVLLLAIFVLAAVIGATISNTATALIVIPIAVSASAELGVSVRPVLMAVTVSCSAAFLMPITTPANLMVMGPGGYKFNDYWKFGLPLLLFYGFIVVLYIPLIWQF
jgi:di/tricarboxylate transporter